MGFFDSFSKGFNDNSGNKDIVDMYHDMYESDPDYRSKAINNSSSNYGWYTCPKCGKKFRKSGMDADHIDPKSRGGDNSRYNLQLICAHCNRSKGADVTDTEKDLINRRKELKQQDKDDVQFLKNISKNSRR